eukprot:scaffold20310_cov125-Isochrysis_galbana.AAC.4
MAVSVGAHNWTVCSGSGFGLPHCRVCGAPGGGLCARFDTRVHMVTQYDMHCCATQRQRQRKNARYPTTCIAVHLMFECCAGVPC